MPTCLRGQVLLRDQATNRENPRHRFSPRVPVGLSMVSVMIISAWKHSSLTIFSHSQSLGAYQWTTPQRPKLIQISPRGRTLRGEEKVRNPRPRSCLSRSDSIVARRSVPYSPYQYCPALEQPDRSRGTRDPSPMTVIFD